MWPCATELQRDVLLKHIFKIVRFGVYNDILNQRSYHSTDSPNGNASQTTDEKRKYKFSAQFNRLNAQLLTIINSNGLAIYCTIVPSGQTQYAVGLFVHILEQQLNSVIPADRVIRVVSVNNASHSGNQLIDAYRDKRDGANIELTVLQDLWHARTRITRELRRDHPQYGNAMYDIKQTITNN